MNKFSIIMPVYNRASVISKSIESVLEQSYKDYELIIIDDGSTDNTKEVVDSFLKKHPDKIQYLYKENTGNPGIARNFGVEHAKSEYIALLDSDDEWDSDYLKKMFFFVEDNNYDWGCCATYRVDDGNFKERTILQISKKYLNADEKTMNLIKYGIFSFTSMPIFTGATIFKKSIFDCVDGFDENFIVGEDSDLWMKFSESNFVGGYLDLPLFFYHKNHSSITRKDTLSLDDNLRLAKKHIKLLKTDKKILRKSYSDFLWNYAPLYYFSGKKIYGMFLLFKSYFVYPEVKKIINLLKHGHKFF